MYVICMLLRIQIEMMLEKHYKVCLFQLSYVNTSPWHEMLQNKILLYIVTDRLY
jgi:hypothetical protein